MGLFSGLRGKGLDQSLDVSTAVMAPIVSAMVADGTVDDDEIRQIRSLCVWSPIYARNSAEQDEEIILRALHLIDENGAEAVCRRAATVLSPGLRETAFIFATRMVFADGFIGSKEQEAVSAIATWLEIDERRARAMVEFVSIMQHTTSS